MTRAPRTWTVVLAALLIAGYAPTARAYLKFGFQFGGRPVVLRWSALPVRYFVNDRDDTPGVSAGAFQAAVSRAFSRWEAVPTSSVAFTFGGFTASLPGEDDGRVTLGFVNQPEMERVLASTNFLVDGVTGELIETDVSFNAAFAWSTAPGGVAGRWDVETIALHEIGHLSGLGHSAIGETAVSSAGRRVVSVGAVMFPIALGPGDVSGRELRPDDVAGVSDLYPDGQFDDMTGSLSGRVTRNGRGLFGAHVVAFDPRTGDMVSNFSLDADGQFAIAGLRPGPYVLRVEPLDDADVESFFDMDDEPVDLGFRVTYYPRLVVVPHGGDSGAVEIAVVSK